MHPRVRFSIALLLLLSGLAAAVPASAQPAAGDAAGRTIDHQSVSGADLRDASVVASTVRDSTLAGAWVRDATLENVRLDRAAVNNATVRGSSGERVLFEGDTLEGGDYASAFLQRVSMSGGSLRDATVDNSTLNGVSLTRVHLCNVRLADQGDRLVTTGCQGDVSGAPTPPTTTPPPATPPPPPTTTPPPSYADIFTTDQTALARFEFNGDARDLASGRDGYLTTAAQFRPTRFGQGLAVGSTGPGLVWTPYAGALTYPFSIEMVVTPDATSGYRKLFGPDDNLDAGWYIHDGALVSYPLGAEIPNVFTAGLTTYLAFITASPTEMDVYADGRFLARTPLSFTTPPPQAIFFRDDRGGGEQFTGTVDALRISTGQRTQQDIQEVLARIGD